MVHVAAQQRLRNHEKVASLLAVFVLRTSAVQRSVELRARGGVWPRFDPEGRAPPANPAAVWTPAARAAQPAELEPPFFWPASDKTQGAPRVQEVGGSPSSSPAPCEAEVSDHDMEQPIASVTPAGGDRYCHFASAAPWVKECHDARKDKDYVAYANARAKAYLRKDALGDNKFGEGYLENLGGLAGPTAFFYAGGTRRLVTQLQSWQLVERSQWPLEDVYCDALGWMDTPAYILYNHTALEALAHWECDKLLLEHPEFATTTMKETVALMHNNYRELLQSVGRKGPGPAMANLKRQALSKCLLGGLACDIANCGLNFCRIDYPGGADYVGHGYMQCKPTKYVD